MATKANISSHITPEILQRQNAEFLAAHPTDDAQIDYYTELAMRLWEEFEIDGAYDHKGTRVNVATWYENKRAQFELFRKHPYWCEEAKAIIFKFNENRVCNFGAASYNMHDMRAYIHRHTRCLPMGDNILKSIEETFGSLCHESDACLPTMTVSFVDKLSFKLMVNDAILPKGAQRMLSVGTKITRFIRKCCEEFELGHGTTINVMTFVDAHESGDRTFKSTEKIFAKLADTLSVLEVNKAAFMSLNFLDFMTMSNGNSWSSCHYINSHGLFHMNDNTSTYHGAYKQGCLSYALDEPSFIFYTLPGNVTETDYYRQQKINRMCCQYKNGTLVTGKCYPNNETGLIAQYRKMIQSIIEVVEQSIDGWEVSDSTNRISRLTQTANGAAHYTDYLIDRQRPSISTCRKLFISGEKQMTIGHNAYCLYCGQDLSQTGREWLQCSRHRRKMICSGCGKKLTDDIAYGEIGGELYCGNCAFFCAVHGRWERISEPHQTILMNDGEVQVCIGSMERLAQCVNCGVYGFKDKMLRTTNGYSCKKHVRRYKKCELCGIYVPNKQVRVDDNGVCACATCDDVRTGKLKFGFIKKDKYDVCDYVLMADEDSISGCVYGSCSNMKRDYANKITRIKRVRQDPYGRGILYEVKSLDGEDYYWCKNCIASKVIGANDSFIGKTVDEVRRFMKGE